jgi:4-deoxy-L-threo-5-hexosulose-uronate ketol-isomerase
MRVIQQVHPKDFKRYATEEIRENFLLQQLLVKNKVEFVYTHYDRMMIGAAFPVDQALPLTTYEELRSEYFLSRRELGIINIAGAGLIEADGETFVLEKLDCLYLGKGKKNVKFSSKNSSEPAKFILFSCPAHHEFPAQLMKAWQASPTEVGSLENNNHRVINKYIHLNGLKSCQLVLGVTSFKKGSVWNTMPPHRHDRRMESYFYFDLAEGQRIIHFMGEPYQTRHLFLNNEEAIVSPPWSIHSGVATGNYSFIWAMAGENLEFTDMDAVNIQSLL